MEVTPSHTADAPSTTCRQLPVGSVYHLSEEKSTMNSHSEASNGQGHIEGIIFKLRELHRKVMKNETRIWLIRSLSSRNLSTRDIYSFVFKQAKLRSHYRLLDKQTVKSATYAKLKDLRLALQKTFRDKKHQENYLTLGT